jgi:hypothetical protein
VKGLAVICALATAGSCSKTQDDGSPEPRPRAAASADQPGASSSKESPAAASILRDLPSCDIDHEGLLLDLGTPATDSRRDHAAGPFQDVSVYERAGATFTRLLAKRVSYDFVRLAAERKVTVSLRMLGIASRVVNVYIDDRRLGALSLPRDEPGIVSTPPLDELSAGSHTVTLRLGGSAQGADEPYAEIDWIRVGSADVAMASYTPPTLRDVVTDVVLDGEPRQSIVLRSPSTVRCTARVAPKMRLMTRVGYWGSGRGVAKVRILEDGESPAVVAERRVSGGTGAVWSPLSVELDPYASRIVGIEFEASESSGGGRIAFGEPALVLPEDGTRVRTGSSRLVVIVVLSGVDRRMIPPWGPVGSFPGIARLLRDGVVYDRYRAPTTVVTSVMASLLTGLGPRAHGVEGPQQRLSEDFALLSDRAKEGSAHAAFFTSVPMSFPVFGFGRSWDKYESFSPVRDVPATEPYALGGQWIKEQVSGGQDGRALLLLHLRGGHPPWDVTKDEAAALPPEEYNGPIEPRAGAIVLSNVRAQRSPVEQRLSGDDWRRLHALEEAALKKQDAELHRFVDFIEREGLYKDALIVLMGDVAAGDPPGIPFAPMPPLREDILLAPLIVKFPQNELAGTHVATMATTVDVAATAIHALELSDEGIEGLDLIRVAKGLLPVDGRPLEATLASRYATRWGPWLLLGDLGRRPSMCLIDVDPSCATDSLTQSPLGAAALWHKTFELEGAARARQPGHAAPAVVLDVDTQSALKVFGY